MDNSKGNKSTIIVILIIAVIVVVGFLMISGKGGSRGHGGIGSTIIINRKEDMSLLQDSKNWNSNFVLNSDIDMSGYTNWLPVGSSRERFMGSFDGRNHKIMNLDINRANETNIGLFGYVGVDGSVSNLTISGAKVYGGQNTGILAAIFEGTASNIKVSGTANGGYYESVGGVFGTFNGNANNILCNVNVNGKSQVGGFAGNIQSGTIKSVHVNSGIKVAGEDKYVGGFVGVTNNYKRITIIECSSKADVSSVGGVCGGFIGYAMSRAADPDYYTEIRDSYSTGDVDKSRVSGGGFIGELASSGSESFRINNCYCVGFVDKSCTTRGGFIGKIEEGSSTSFKDDFWVNLYTDGYPTPGVSGEKQKEQYVKELIFDFSTNDLIGWNDGKWNIEKSGYPKTRITLESEPNSNAWNF